MIVRYQWASVNTIIINLPFAIYSVRTNLKNQFKKPILTITVTKIML